MTALLPRLAFVGVAAVLGALGMLLLARRIRATENLVRRLGALGDGGLERAPSGRLAQALIESGLGWTVGMFLGRLALVAAIALASGLLLGGTALGLLFATGAIAAMAVVVRAARARRLRLCDEQMPQALEIVAMALRAGHALPRALTLAASEAPQPIAGELARAVAEHELGRPVDGVLVAFGARLPGCASVGTFVVAVSVLQETGGNLVAVIDRIVDNARARTRYRARLRALTAEGRQSAKLLAMLPGAFALLAMLSDPGYADTLLHTGGGRLVGLVALGMWLAGVLWTRRLVAPAQ